MRYRWIAVATTALALAACGDPSGQPAANVTSPSPTTAQTPTRCSVPQPLPDLCVGRAATTSEAQAIVAAGTVGAEQDLRLKDMAQCTVGDACFKPRSPSDTIVGTNAAVFSATSGTLGADGSNLGLGSACAVFVTNDGTAWHYAAAACVQNPGFLPGPSDHVYVPSACANVRSAPGLKALVLDCLAKNTIVNVDSAPVFQDGYIWWHLVGRGWMANDFLIPPPPH